MKTDLTTTATGALDRDARDPLHRYLDRHQPLDDPEAVYLGSLGRPLLDTHAVVSDAISLEWGRELTMASGRWHGLARQVGDVIATGVLEAEPGEVIVSDSHEVNLYKLAAAALGSVAARRVIVTDDDHHPRGHVLAGIAHSFGAEVRVIAPSSGGVVTPDQVRDAIGVRADLVVLSHVSAQTGARADVAGITDIAHDSGAYVLWDLSRSAGVLPTPLTSADVDLAVGSTEGYLCGGPGGPGYLYVRHELQQQLQQPIWGRHGQPDGEDWISLFGSGMPSIFGTYAVLEGARLIAEVGIDAIRSKAKTLTSYAVDLADAWLSEHGVRLVTPRDASARGGDVVLHHPRAWQVVQAAQSAGVITDYVHPGLIRLTLAPLAVSYTNVYEALSGLADVLRDRAYLAHPDDRPITAA
jgi:kynureninase